MSLARCFDAAFPPATAPDGAQAVMGYIGPDPAATNVWTVEQWRRFTHLRQFPNRVIDYAQDPRAQARLAVSEVRALGWNPNRGIIGDLEDHVDPLYWSLFEEEVEQLGYVPIAYESESVVGKNRAKRVWAALWDGRPTIPAGSGWWAKQYLSAGAVDWSVLTHECLLHGGIGPRT
jgi:hypothetical protein